MMRKPVCWALPAPLAILGLAVLALAGCSHGGGAPVAAADDGCPRFLGHHACELERAQHPQAAQAPGPASPTAPASAPASSPPPVVAMAPEPAHPSAPAPASLPTPADTGPAPLFPVVSKPLWDAPAHPAPPTAPPSEPVQTPPPPSPSPVLATAAPPPMQPAKAPKPAHHFFWQSDAPAAPKPQVQVTKPAETHHFFWQQAKPAPQPPIAGGYQSADAGSKAVAAAAAFAVHESPGYILKGIYSAHTQVVAGTNYGLCLWVRQMAHEANPIHRRMVEAIVYQGLDGHYELTEWHEVNACHAGS